MKKSSKLTHKNAYKALCCTIMFLCILLVAQISVVSAEMEWDNRETYYPEKAEYIIEDNLKLGADLAKLKRITPQIFTVIDRGVGIKQRVAEMDIESYQVYDNWFNSLRFENLKESNKSFERDYEIRYKIENIVEVPYYFCTKFENEHDPELKNCTETKYAYSNYQDLSTWELLNETADIQKGNITIGIFLDVKPREKSEWYLTAWGRELPAWAAWTEGFNDPMNETSGANASDVGGAFYGNEANGTITVNSKATFLPGKIGYAFNSSKDSPTEYMNFTDDPTKFGDIFSGINNVTINLWVYPTLSMLPVQSYLGEGHNTPHGFFRLGEDGAHFPKICLYMEDTNGGRSSWYTNSEPTVGDWSMVSLVYNGTVAAGAAKIYINGVEQGTTHDTGFSAASPNQADEGVDSHMGYDIMVNDGQFFNGMLDEVSFWNRTLSASEITDLYNNGSGITFSSDFNSVQAILNLPDNYYNETVSTTVNLQCNATSTGLDLSSSWVDVYNTDGTFELSNYESMSGTSDAVTHSVTLTNNNVYNWSCWANNTDNSIIDNSNNRTINVTIAGAAVTLNFPVDALNTTSPSVDFNCSVVGDNSVNITLFIDAVENYTTFNLSTTSFLQLNLTNQFGEGNYNWTCKARDTNNLESTTGVRTFNIDFTPPDINVSYPSGNFSIGKIGQNITLNWSTNDINSTCIYNYNGTNTSVVCADFNSSFTLEPRQYSLSFYINDSFDNFNETSVSWMYKIFINQDSFNATTYETSIENFYINVSSDGTQTVTANIDYNGTVNLLTKSGNNSEMNFSFSQEIPLGSGNVTFFWNFLFGTDSINDTNSSQFVGDMNLTTCNPTDGTPFFNITFIDETYGTSINASVPLLDLSYWLGDGVVNKTLSIVNSTENFNYTFCFIPAHKTPDIYYNIQYQSSGYQQRATSALLELVTNNSITQTLSLLSNTIGQFVTFQTINSAEQPVSSVFVNATRLISGVNTIVGGGFTDAAGTITFWLNPNFLHTFAFDTDNVFALFITSLFPTQTSYTINLGQSQNVTEFDTSKGISYDVKPKIDPLLNGTFYIFNFSTSSNFWTIEEFGFNLRNSSGTSLNVLSSSSNGGSVSINRSTGNNSDIIMDYYWITNGTYSNASRVWRVRTEEDTDWSIKTFFIDLENYIDIGFFGLDEFGKAILVFFVIFLIVGGLSFKFGLITPVAISSIAWGVIAFFDVGLDLVPNPINAVPHFITIFVSLIMVSILIREVVK